MRFITGVLTVFVTAIVTYFVMLAGLAASLVMFACYVSSFLLLFVSAFSVLGYLATGKPHFLSLAVIYLAYAAIAFAVPIVLAFVPIRIRDLLAARSKRQALQRIGGLRIKADTRFHETAH